MVEASWNNVRHFLLRIYLMLLDSWKHSHSIKDRWALTGWRVMEQLTHSTLFVPPGGVVGDNPCWPWAYNHTPSSPSVMIVFQIIFTIVLQSIVKYLVNALVTKSISSHHTCSRLQTNHSPYLGYRKSCMSFFQAFTEYREFWTEFLKTPMLCIAP